MGLGFVRQSACLRVVRGWEGASAKASDSQAGGQGPGLPSCLTNSPPVSDVHHLAKAPPWSL